MPQRSSWLEFPLRRDILLILMWLLLLVNLLLISLLLLLNQLLIRNGCNKSYLMIWNLLFEPTSSHDGIGSPSGFLWKFEYGFFPSFVAMVA